MKKLVLFILVLVSMFVFCSCNDSENRVVIGNKNNNNSYVNQQTINQSKLNEEKVSAKYVVSDYSVKTWISSIGTTRSQVIVEITNTGNTNLFLSSSSYDIEDSSGKLVGCQSYVSVYPNVLAPGEKGYMYDVSSIDVKVNDESVIVPHFDVRTAEVDLIRFPVSDISLTTNSYGKIKMLGRVTNTSREEQGFVYVVAFLYDNEGKCIGLLDTIISNDIAAGDKVGFEISDYSLPDDIKLETITDYVVYAYPMQYQY